MSIVKVKPIENESSWHGKTGKDAFARPVTIEALVSITTQQYCTGLSEEDRARLEAITKYDLSPEYAHGIPHPFYSTATAEVKLIHGTNTFNTSRPLDEIRLGILKASDLVANSLEAYEAGDYPEAKFIIFDEKEELEAKASKAALKRNVIIEAAKLTSIRKAEIVQILSNISVKNQSDDYISMMLDKEVEEKGPQVVLDLIKRDKARTALHSMLIEGLHKNILRKEGPSIYYLGDQLGYDIESTLDYFEDKKNQTLKAQILEKINS